MKSSSNRAITIPLIYVVLFVILIVSLATFGIKKYYESKLNIKTIGLVNNAIPNKKIARTNNNIVTSRSGNTLRRNTTMEKSQDNNSENSNENNDKSEGNTEKNEDDESGEKQIQTNIENTENNDTKSTDIEKKEEIENIEETPAEKYVSIKDVKISKNMDLTVRTGLSRNDFIKLISGVKADTSGFFEQNAGTIYDLCEQYSINEIFFCGLISAESGWNIAGNHRSSHNYISLMKNGKLIHYSSVEEGLRVAAQKLHSNYLTPGGKFYHGKTLKDVQTKFCPSSSWVDLVYGRMQQII